MKVRYRSEAKGDLSDIYSYILAYNPIAAKRVIGEIRARVNELPMFPEKYRVGPISGQREMPIRKYGYIVVYEIDRHWINILAIFHAAQDRPRGPAE